MNISSALIVEHKPPFNPYHKYERPPYTKGFNIYNNSRYRQTENYRNGAQNGLREIINGDLRAYIDKNWSDK